MLFTSYEFLGFLLVVFVMYYLLPGRAQWSFLLIASYAFYFMADPRYLIFIMITTASTFLVAQYLGGTGDKMIGDVIENIFQRDKNVGSAISLALMVIILILVVIMNKFGDEEAAVA